jgi:general stress protein 26
VLNAGRSIDEEECPMSRIDDTEVSRLLEAAAKLTASAPICWLATAPGTGAINARPMGRVPPDPNSNDWKVTFLTDARSRKAAEIKSAPGVEVIYQNDSDQAFAALAGAARLIERRDEVEKLWQPGYEAFFPTPEDRGSASFIEVTVNRMELWIRGVTPEPFGIRSAVIARKSGGAWEKRDDP